MIGAPPRVGRLYPQEGRGLQAFCGRGGGLRWVFGGVINLDDGLAGCFSVFYNPPETERLG
jgi:hypothetical protein